MDLMEKKEEGGFCIWALLVVVHSYATSYVQSNVLTMCIK